MALVVTLSTLVARAVSASSRVTAIMAPGILIVRQIVDRCVRNLRFRVTFKVLFTMARGKKAKVSRTHASGELRCRVKLTNGETTS